MDDNHLLMIRDSLEEIKGECRGIRQDVKEHISKDEGYWKKLERAEGQVSIIKWLFSGLSLSGLMAWLFQTFGKH